MTRSEYSLMLRKGISGGLVQRIPDAVYTITRPKGHAVLNISCAERSAGTPSLQELAPRTISDSDAEAVIEELHSILKRLPTESPPGSEDIYGLDTSIAWGSDDLMWCNGGPEGCGGGTSKVQVSQEQKADFKRAVEIIEQIAKKE